MANDELIRLEGLHFAYPNCVPLFTGIDFVLKRGELVGIVGPNGSGKTTLFRILVGLLRPRAGRLFAFGKEIRKSEDHDLLHRRIGYLFQHSEDQLFCPTVAEDAAFRPLNLGRTPEQTREIVAETLSNLGLVELADRISYELSGGERQRAALATVLAMQPEVLLLDEPATGLDPRAKRELVELLTRIGKTQVIASHDMEFVRATCRRVIVMDAGRPTADGLTDEVLGDGELMLRHGLEVPHSLAAERAARLDHHHGAGPSHGHGHGTEHDRREHE